MIISLNNMLKSLYSFSFDLSTPYKLVGIQFLYIGSSQLSILFLIPWFYNLHLFYVRKRFATLQSSCYGERI